VRDLWRQKGANLERLSINVFTIRMRCTKLFARQLV
jgi:hypothetical protein